MGQETGRDNCNLNDIGWECFYHTSVDQREMCPPRYLQGAGPVKCTWLLSSAQKACMTSL